MRALESYEVEGREAYCDGISLDACPYDEGTVRRLEWRIGHLRTSAEDWTRDELHADLDPLEITPMDLEREEATSETRRRDRVLERVRSKLPSIAEVEAAVGPTSTWPANCWGVADALLRSGLLSRLESEFGQARLCYGSYDGWISRSSIFAGGSFARHGWIEFDSGFVLDPTRWVFHDSAPELSVACIGDYDLANRRLRDRALRSRPVPAHDDGSRLHRWDVNDPEVTDFVVSLLGERSAIGTNGVVSASQAIWLGGQPLAVLGHHAGEIYRALARQGLIAAVPLDHRIYLGMVPAPDVEDDAPAPSL